MYDVDYSTLDVMTHGPGHRHPFQHSLAPLIADHVIFFFFSVLRCQPCQWRKQSRTSLQEKFKGRRE